MFARSLTLIGAAAVFATVAGADIHASGHKGHHKKARHHQVAGHAMCMKKVRLPDVYETRRRKVKVSRGHCTRHRTAAVYGWKQVQIVEKRAHRVRHREPAVYGWKQVEVMKHRGRKVRHHSPAVYKTVTVHKEVRPARTVWKRKRKGGEVYKCQVTIPAKVRTHHKRVLVTPAKRWVETKPAVMGYKKVRVLVKPARRWVETKPAVMGYRKVRTVVSRGKTERICTPPTYKWVEHKVRVKRGGHTWVKSKGPKC